MSSVSSGVWHSTMNAPIKLMPNMLQQNDTAFCESPNMRPMLGNMPSSPPPAPKPSNVTVTTM